jgi:hypothetical protein
MTSHPLTRRELLVRAGAGAALLGAGTAGYARAAATAPATATAPTPPATAGMLKGISLIGDVNAYGDGLGVRPYLLGGARPVDVVGLWVGWTRLQPTAPQPFTLLQTFLDLSDPAGPAAATLTALDAQIAQANADGRNVLLTVYQSFPDWTHPSIDPLDPGNDPARGGNGRPDLGQGRLANDARIVDDLTPEGPWAWFVAYLCARYARVDGPPPAAGPGRGGSVGNPSGAYLDWLAPLNEPNLTWWPQRSAAFPGGTIEGAVATLMRTAATVAARYRNGDARPQGPALLMPGTADVVHPGADHGTPWHEFTDGVLAALAGWQPETPVGWAHHNYADVKHGVQDSGRWRAEDAIALLTRYGWADPAVWLTEGGYEFDVRRVGSGIPQPYVVADPPAATAEQARLIAANWAAMAQLPVRLWTHYLVNDRDVRFQSSLRGPVQANPAGAVVPCDPPYPAYAMWQGLGA